MLKVIFLMPIKYTFSSTFNSMRVKNKGVGRQWNKEIIEKTDIRAETIFFRNVKINSYNLDAV